MTTRDLIRLAQRHGGVIATREARELGVPKSTLDRRVSDGVFVRLGRGILALPGTATRPDALQRAAGRLLGAVVSHESAARIHGMGPVPHGDPSVTVPHRGTHDFPGLKVHQSTDLRPEHTSLRNGLRVTTPERTIVDLSKTLAQPALGRVLDSALASDLVEFDDLVDLFVALRRRGKKGSKNLDRLLRERTDDSSVPISVLERELVSLIRRAGLPKPVREFSAPWLQVIDGRVDFAYVDHRIVIEADSRRWHGLFQAFEVDKRRDNAAQIEGWIVLRVTWVMIKKDPMYVVGIIKNALASREPASRGG